MLKGTANVVIEEIPRLPQRVPHYMLVAPNGQQVPVDVTSTWDRPGGVDRDGRDTYSIEYDPRPRVFCAPGQGERTFNNNTRCSIYGNQAWRAQKGVNYEAAGFVKTRYGTAFYDPKDSVQAQAANTYDLSGRVFGFRIGGDPN